MASSLESHHHLLTALNLCKETGDRRLLAVILNNLAYHQWRFLGRPAEAIRTYHESIQIFADNGDQRGTIYSYYDVSKAYLKVGLLGEAREFLSRALQTAITLDNLSLILHALHGYVLLFADLGERERALGLCYLLENHPALEHDTKKRVIVTRIQLETILPIEVIDSAQRWGELVDLKDVLDQILANNYPL
jgi:tetratricopeptide (TPR) repeat protein